MKKNLVLILLFLYLKTNFAHKFLKTEACEVKGRLFVIDKCELVDDSIIYKIQIFKAITKCEVSFSYNFCSIIF